MVPGQYWSTGGESTSLSVSLSLSLSIDTVPANATGGGCVRV